MSTMRTVSMRNLAAHKLRLALTVVSVLLGTAFVAGSFVFTDTLDKSFTTIFQTSDAGIDARVQATHDYDPGVPLSVISRIAAVPGVRAVQPDISAPIVLVGPDGKKINSGGAPSVGAAWADAGESVNPVPTFVAGHAPRSADQVVVNDGAARRHHLAAGDQVKIVTSGGQVASASISGIYRVSFDTGGYVGALFTRERASALFTDAKFVSTVDVAAQPGVSEQAVTAAIAAVLPPGLVAKTGTQVRDADTQDVNSALSFVNYILLGFGFIALLVGTFIIYNTFSMIVAQRQRELALLRAIGASGRQVRRSVLLEAGVIGVIGSALGLAAGVGLAYGLRTLLESFDLGLPSGALVVSLRTVVFALLVGTVVTLLAALTPARRAASIAPVAAMREEFAAPSAASLRRRTVAGSVVIVLGAAASVAGFAASSTGIALQLLALGLLGVCAGVLLLSPVLARWIIEPLGRVVGRPFGTIGRLARTNAVRNPRRTAATGFALTVGLVLVAGVAVLGSSAKASVKALVDNHIRADFLLTSQLSVGVPHAAATAARAVDGVETITELHSVSAALDGKHDFGTAVDGPLASVFSVPIVRGRLDLANGMLVSADTAKQHDWQIGSRHTLTVAGRPPQRRTVTGIYANNALLGPWLVDGGAYRALTPSSLRNDEVALVSAAPRTDAAALRAGLERATNDFYVVDVQSRSDFAGSVAADINGLIGLLYGLLALAIVIAILGIVNTLALSVVERRREIGMLRAVGMQRKQVRRTIYLESLLIAVFGAALGLGIGVGYGALFTDALRDQGLNVLSVPWLQSALFLVIAAVVGVLAAGWPGIRAARTSPLAAIATA